MAQIVVFGRVTADPELKESQKGISYVCFDLAEHIGYGGGQRTLFYQVWAWGDDALRLIRMGVKKGSMIWLTGTQDLVDCTESGGNVKTKRLKVSMDNCGFLPGWKAKHDGVGMTGAPSTSPDMTVLPPAKVLDGEREAMPE